MIELDKYREEFPRIIMPYTFPSDLPLAASKADVVQAFFTKVLVDEYDVPKRRAEQVSAKWEFGSGREVATFPKATYIDILWTRGWRDLIRRCTKAAPAERAVGSKNPRSL